jgi:hypothetical protein
MKERSKEPSSTQIRTISIVLNVFRFCIAHEPFFATMLRNISSLYIVPEMSRGVIHDALVAP